LVSAGHQSISEFRWCLVREVNDRNHPAVIAQFGIASASRIGLALPKHTSGLQPVLNLF
jgi:hypothetical protein